MRVDDEDFEYISLFRWHGGGSKQRYAKRMQSGPKKKFIYAHREILGAPSGMEVDHIDGNSLNNQKSNLRLCSHRENCSAFHSRKGRTNPYRGVSWHKTRGQFIARIRVNYLTIFLGWFTVPEDAAKAYDIAAVKHFGEFANLNFPTSTPIPTDT